MAAIKPSPSPPKIAGRLSPRKLDLILRRSKDLKMWMISSGYVKIAIENDPVEIVDFPIKNGDFP